MRRLFLLSTVIVFISGCNSWVQVTNEGESVRLGTNRDVANCQRIGRAQAQTLSRFVVVERGGERLQEELTRIARNEAGDMGGNVIIPESIIEEGRQSFGVFRCP
jgi:hypothetical protein